MAADSRRAKQRDNDRDEGPTYYIEDQPAEARARYQSKLRYDKGTKTLPDPYRITSGWTNDMSSWPDVTYGDIYNYLIESPGIYTKKSLKAYKSLDAYRFVQSGHVQEVFYHDISNDSPFCFLKAKVTPSQRVTDKPHQPWICVAKEDGEIYCAHCTCMAGLGEVCSHVAATMFKVQIAVQLGLTTKSSTSDVCQWNSNFRKEIEPKTVSELQTILKGGNRTKPVETVFATGKDDVPPIDILKSLYDVCPNATFFTTVPPVVELCPQTGDKSTSSNEKAPRTLLSLNREGNVNEGDISDLCRNVWEDYVVTEQQAQFLETLTSKQNVCERWFEHRKGRITATKVHDVITRKETTHPDNLVKKVMGYSSYDLSKNKAVKWGIDSEDSAKKQYANAMKSHHNDFKVSETGLLIDYRHPFLGASADGVRFCSCCGKGVMEVKCPFKHKSSKIDIAATTDSSFCLDKDLKLKKSHRYYTQIQVQMHVHNVLFCDFIVFTECDMIINVVPYDAEFCRTVVDKCKGFFMDYVLPEIITGKLHGSLEEACQAVEPEKVYCLCNQPAYGKMVQCSNAEDCPCEWFHYECVNIRRKPRGKWMCPNCR